MATRLIPRIKLKKPKDCCICGKIALPSQWKMSKYIHVTTLLEHLINHDGKVEESDLASVQHLECLAYDLSTLYGLPVSRWC